MEFIDKKIQEYAELHTAQESDLLQAIHRETYLEVLAPRMLSGQLQGRMLAMYSQMMRPDMILEIGTYTGYSALCLAEGLAENGKLITVDINEELEGRVRRYISRAGLAHRIDYRIGNALDIIPKIDETLDMVFLDADKENYRHYYDMVLGKLRVGGIIIADNVLWSGKVLGGVSEKIDKDTQALMAFNDFVQHDDRVENVLMPVRDGLMLIRKK